uniref:F-box domain-containing protein n=1 Tax=Caenorhabditis tropicalis TaxID=1561998 RepID=A0A1I7UTG5_9PELO
MFTPQIVPSDQTDQNDQSSDFLNLPDVVMRDILTKCDLTSIMNLMKVCRALHDFIHRSPPTAIAEKLVVYIGDKNVYFCLTIPVSMFIGSFLHWSSENITLRIDNHENGCSVWRNRVRSYVKNEDFVSVACNYLSAMLRRIGTINQFVFKYLEDRCEYKPSIWDRLKSTFYCSKQPLFQPPSSNEITTRVVDTIEECLQSRGRLMQVTHLTVGLEEPYPDILNLFDPIPLKTLKISRPNKYPEINIKRLKNLDSVTINADVPNPIQDFFHIRHVELIRENISDEEFLDIKNRFMNSTSLNINMEINIKSDRSIVDQVHKLFGPTPKNICWGLQLAKFGTESLYCYVSSSRVLFFYQ